MKAYRIKGWDKHYENNRSRELKKPEWLPLPNSFDGRGYMELCDNPAGMSHYGAWCMLLAAASRMPTRGLLVADSGAPLTIKDLARMTRGAVRVFEEAIPRLMEIGWIDQVEMQPVEAATDERAGGSADADRSGPHPAAITQHGAGIPHAGAEKSALEGEGEIELEGEGGETRATPHPPLASAEDDIASTLRSLALKWDDPELIAEWSDFLRGPLVGAKDLAEQCAALRWMVKQTLSQSPGTIVRYARHVHGMAPAWRARQKPQAAPKPPSAPQENRRAIETPQEAKERRLAGKLNQVEQHLINIGSRHVAADGTLAAGRAPLPATQAEPIEATP